MTGEDGEEIVEPSDADCEDAHPPPELLELHEVLEFQAATAGPVSADEVREAEGLPPIDPPKRPRKPKKGGSE